jgi:hypothetical protein
MDKLESLESRVREVEEGLRELIIPKIQRKDKKYGIRGGQS